MRVYAVIDTNVLVSFFLTKNLNSATARVIDAIATGNIVPLHSEDILSEYDEVLHVQLEILRLSFYVPYKPGWMVNDRE